MNIKTAWLLHAKNTVSLLIAKRDEIAQALAETWFSLSAFRSLSGTYIDIIRVMGMIYKTRYQPILPE